ncbi:putative homoserine kinase type II (protein kinase fold) [Arthrobacter crystallopoietes BAB-32]|uniref:Putative homoserine kinase type II (Protein kinase fold) n=1 Tax=Arthrobacter crystallopoietes BAB-32 TaxID=1246476 RepID=N1V0U5_9MICC|nr:phosphotransferase [Arthrobacter crystallopoietes]EMY33654.1 putative homoserine kinase type II (protein kinase fold) [Arthrobacter crystallopoietes BAB-32]
MTATALDASLPALDALLDPGRLRALLGRPAKAGHLRYKPGVSVLARLESAVGIQWAAGFHPDYAGKLRESFDRAAALNAVLETLELPGTPGHQLVCGPVELDSRLYHPLRGSGLPLDRIEVLSYNSGRHLVVAFDDADAGRLVAHITDKAAKVPEPLLERLRQAGVPVLGQLNPGFLPEEPDFAGHTACYPWYGTTDLLQLARSVTAPGRGFPLPAAAGQAPSESAPQPLLLAASAGQALARLHAQPFCSGTEMAAGPQPKKLADAASELLPELRSRLQGAAERLIAALRHAGRAGFVHGGFSADRILVGADGIRIINLERCGYGAVVSDLGCFAAVELLELGSRTLTEALLDGYREAHGVAGEGVAIDPEELRAWTAAHLYARILQPFRECEPDWRIRITRRLTQIEELL